MINLLPPDVKEQIAYSKRNSALIRLAVTMVVLTGLIVLGLNYSGHSLEQTIKSTASEKTSQQKLLTDPALEKTLIDINQRLGVIGQINKTKHHYSKFLRTLGAALPAGTWIGGVQLNGQNAPFNLSVNSKTQAMANGVRDAIAKSPEVQSVDLVSVTNNGGTYITTVSVLFKPDAGQQ